MHAQVSMTITNEDFAKVIARAGADDFIYADPPYWKQGPNLYKHAFATEDHVRLRDALRATPAQWALSYDDAPEVRDLYSGFEIASIETGYSMAPGARRKNHEILIMNM